MKDPRDLFSKKFRQKYKIGKCLGFGSFGGVFMGVQPDLGRPVAVKALVRERRQEEAEKRFMQEAKLAARVEHANVVTVYDSGVDEGMPYIIYELVDGRSLDVLLKQKSLGLSRVLGLMEQIAQGLSAIHDVAVVHRDMKPENILVDKRGQVRITDLGIAKDGWSDGVKTATGMVLGTPAYMAPEYFVDGAVDGACDVYALGVIFYEALAGRKPFSGTVVEMIEGHLKKAAAPLTQVPTKVAELVYAMLDKEPAQRPSAWQVVERLRNLQVKLDSLPVAEKAAKSPQVRPLLPYACVFLLAVLLIVAGNFWDGSSAEQASGITEPLRYPLELSDSEFTKQLMDIRLQRQKLSAAQLSWLVQAAREGAELGDERILEMVPIVKLLPHSNEKTIVICHLAAALVHFRRSKSIRQILLAKRLVDELTKDELPPTLAQFFNGVKILAVCSLMNETVVSDDEFKRLMKEMNERLLQLGDAFENKTFDRLDIWEWLILARVPIHVGYFKELPLRLQIVAPLMKRLVAELAGAKDKRKVFHLKDSLLALQMNNHQDKRPEGRFLTKVPSRVQTLQYCKDMQIAARDEFARIWYASIEAHFHFHYRQPIHALRTIQEVSKNLPPDTPKNLRQSIVQFALSVACKVSRSKKFKDKPQAFASRLALGIAKEHYKQFKGEARQIALLRMADLHKYLGGKAEATKYLKEVLTIRGDSELKEQARRGLLYLGDEKERLLLKRSKISHKSMDALINEINSGR